MTNAILIDDELILLSGLQIMLRQLCPQINILTTCTNAADAKIKIKELQPQLLFLDINMPGKSGFDLLNEIDTQNIEIIFITAHNSYALQAFKYSAIDYILKPVDEDELVDAVKKACKKIEDKKWKNGLDSFLHNIKMSTAPQEMKLCLPSISGFQVIDIKDIVVCIAEGAYTNFILTNNKKVTASRPLLDYEQLLQDNSFIRIHKSNLINVNHVKQYLRGEGGSVILSNGMEIEVSRRKKEHFIEMMKTAFKY
jgi:two-component system, LytTR family, response regulator